MTGVQYAYYLLLHVITFITYFKPQRPPSPAHKDFGATLDAEQDDSPRLTIRGELLWFQPQNHINHQAKQKRMSPRWIEDEMKWDEHTEITNSCPSAVGSESFWKRGSNRCGTAWLCSQSCSLPVASPNRLIIIFPSRFTPVQAASREWRSTEGRARTSGTARRNQDWNDSELGHSWAHKLDYCVYLLFESGSNGFSTANPCQGCYCPRFQRATAAELFIPFLPLALGLGCLFRLMS